MKFKPGDKVRFKKDFECIGKDSVFTVKESRSLVTSVLLNEKKTPFNEDILELYPSIICDCGNLKNECELNCEDCV